MTSALVSLLVGFHRHLGSIRRNESGGLLIAAALIIPILIMMTGVAIDYSNLTRTKTALQSVVDTAALSAAIEGGGNKKEARLAAVKIFDDVAKSNGIPSATISNFTIEDASFTVTATIDVPLFFGSFFGMQSSQVAASARAESDIGSGYEIALVLDNTFSMKGQKIKDLKSAATRFLDVMSEYEDADIRVSLVPFSRYVNIGTQNRNKYWLDAPETKTTTKQVCRKTRDVIRTYNCRNEVRHSTKDGVKQTKTRRVCQKEYGPQYEKCWDRRIHTEWRGCVGSRNAPYDTLADYMGRPIIGLTNKCGIPLIELTDDFDPLYKAIGKMNVNDETYLPAGFNWGWRTLSPNAPFRSAHDNNLSNKEQVEKILIIMTDGHTTTSPRYPAHTGKNVQQSDQLMETLCDNIKDDGIRVITVKVSDGLPGGDTFLECASSPLDAFLIEESSRLESVFESIAHGLGATRLTQ